MKHFLWIFPIVMALSCSNSDKINSYSFYGDSHVALWDTDYYFGNEDITNKGIGGLTITKLISNIENEVVVDDGIIIEIGYNDITALKLSGQSDSLCLGVLKVRYDQLISECKKQFEFITFLSILPHSESFHGVISRNLTIEANKHLKTIAENDIAIQYIEIGEDVTNEAGLLEKFFSVDGIHLNRLGYDNISKYVYDVF